MAPTNEQQAVKDENSKENKEKGKNANNDIEHVKSRAVVKYSAVQVPSNFARLQCNTDLNLPPSNWLTSSAESYGLQHVLSKSTGFSSFRMAHMFPDCMGEVDVVSDAENIKKLLKIPYSRDAVSMMVHCIEKTLLIDEFDIHKHLLRTSESDWEWLRKFFVEQVLQTLSEKDVGISTKNKSRHALQQRALVSKFLHYSLAEPEQENEPVAGPSHDQHSQETLTKIWPPLPEPRLEEETPDPATEHTFNRNVVWTFEDIQMLLGTDLPIFGGPTHPCISLRLRDMAKPISVLTGIDYWLDNLMCNVPEVIMCFHLDGIVQRYELVKTEDLPQLPDSQFSPNIIRDVAQNILSFLKTNATKAGHTYWLFKGKDQDIVKLYDLTSLCSDGLMKDGQNPFTVPVAMLFYRVARNMKHSTEPSSMKPGTIRALLKNCVSLLPREKYPQIVTSAHYMLSDLYMPLTEEIKDEPVSPEPSGEDEDEEQNTSPIQSLTISNDMQPPPLPRYVPPPPVVGSIAQRAGPALEHVLAGLQCLPFFEISDPTTDKTEKNEPDQEPKMAQSHQPIPMPYSSLTPEKTKENKTKEVKPSSNKRKHKKKKHENKRSEKPSKVKASESSPEEENKESSILDQFPVYFWNSDKKALLKKQQVMAMPTWETIDTMDNASWKDHLRTLLYEKACLVFYQLAEEAYKEERHGHLLRYVRRVLLCHTHMARGCGRCHTLISAMLGRAGDSCFHIAQNWLHAEAYFSDYSQQTEVDKALDEEMALDIPNCEYPYECILIPKKFESKEQMLLSACSCYQQALMLRPCDALRSRLGNVHNELSGIYMNKIMETDLTKLNEIATKTQLDTLITLAQHHLNLGKAQFAEMNQANNLALLYSNAGRLNRLQAHFRINPLQPSLKPVERMYYEKAIQQYQDGLKTLGNRKSEPAVWDTIMFELSSTVYTMATLYQDNPPSMGEKSQEEVERESIELLTRALQAQDLDDQDPVRHDIYHNRAAMLHYRLGSFYQHMYRTKPMEDSKRKNVLRLVNLHYDKSALLMDVSQYPLENLRLWLERFALQDFFSENSNTNNGKVKALQLGLDYLLSSKTAVESIIKRSRQGNESETQPQLQEEKDLLELLESRLQFVLKSLAKLALSSTNPKVSSLAATYKEMYSFTLKKKPQVFLPKHLHATLEAIEQLR
ncbi:erythroid differentiation-related factor 1 isoform X2 [Homalodisca vitripennis]|uniref:erythroid differentiation-related factor 1 isoform X2 n=1 Tax=Homalodisca vitripennis TaxID=197043 RepID=UPI001EEA0728|nr:erythroid differentiation-related factor 1 isoform X2 [Homalodisca vitripennis]